MDKFPRGVYVSPPSVFDEIREEGIDIPRDWDFFPHFATFGFECFMVPTSAESGGHKLQWTFDHIPLSVSICSNVSGYKDPVCFVSQGDPKAMVGDTVQYLIEISQHSNCILQECFGGVICALTEKIQNSKEGSEGTKQSTYLQNLLQKLTSHLQQLPTFGFNSGRYDINLVKHYLLPYLVKNEPIRYLVRRT